jgi:hypothetical protein
MAPTILRKREPAEGQGICIWVRFRKKANGKHRNNSDDGKIQHIYLPVQESKRFERVGTTIRDFKRGCMHACS